MKKIALIFLAVGIIFAACGCSSDAILDELPFYFGESYEDAQEDMKDLTDDIEVHEKSITGNDISLFGSDVNPCYVILGVEEGDDNGITGLSLGFSYILREDPDYKEKFQKDYEFILDKLQEAYGEPTDDSTMEETKWYNDDVEVTLDTDEFDMRYANGNVGMQIGVSIDKIEENEE